VLDQLSVAVVQITHQYRVGQKRFNLFLSELYQIFTKFANFWHVNGQDNTIV